MPPRSAKLAEDETDLRLFPPLRAGWARRGEEAPVPISGGNAKRVLFGAINIETGHRLFLPCRHKQGLDFEDFLGEVCSCSSCSSCSSCETKGVFNRMRGMFGSKHSGCESCDSRDTCGSCGSYGSYGSGSSYGGEVIPHGVQTMPRAGELIPGPTSPPKKMPGGDKKTGLLPQTEMPAEPIAAPASPRPLELRHSPY